MSSTNFTSVHAQIRLSSLVGSSIASEDIFASLPVDLGETSIAHLQLKRTISVVVTPGILEHLRLGYAQIEYFAEINEEYPSRLERWDRSRELRTAMNVQGTSKQTLEAKPTTRRSEPDLVASERHDVLANVEILELENEGEYVPAEVTNDIFQLHQGLQRRIRFTLTHTSGQSFLWTQMTHISTSDIRLLTKGHMSPVSGGAVEMRISSPDIQYFPDGTSRFQGSAAWETAAHQCQHLDRRTPSDQVLIVRIVWLVEVETLEEPAAFSMDIAIRIRSRDAKRSSFMSLFGGSKTYNSITNVFTVNLAPPIARSATDLWRFDTAKKHVNGEESLRGWMPRSLSLLEDFERLRHTQLGLADVQAIEAVLRVIGEVQPSNQGERDRQILLMRCVAHWQETVKRRGRVGELNGHC